MINAVLSTYKMIQKITVKVNSASDMCYCKTPIFHMIFVNFSRFIKSRN